jgi:CheY-like chemotaxis protein
MNDELILVADDAAFMRKVIRMTLTEVGLGNIVEAKDGEEAVALFKDKHPSLVLLDITMEKKNGSFEVHLKAKGNKGLREMYVTINSKTYIPSQIRIHHKKGWNTIDIRDFKKAKLSDAIFRFNSKDFPTAEVIDLR